MDLSDSVVEPAGAQAAVATRSLTVEVFFDFVCPWCLIGKRQFDAAARRLAELRPDVHLQVVWRSHALLPNTPAGGVPYQAFYVARLGSPEAVARRRAQVQQAGTAAGVRFAFDRIEVLPNTARAHAWVARTGKALQAKLIDRIFTAYLLEGEDIGDGAVLERLALECGVQADVCSTDEERPEGAGYPVSGVPFFVFDGSLALPGAATSDMVLDVMLRALGA
ncbi:DsbA family oxidoreductase [Variovorax sp. YR216]|uniref:DsbA family oxidoreductase n=1 Tax=Variovorax sp. YR216 TaxID=1882828 RepID=UPI000896B5EA|nr:DsbA family oxidoreductase [Variovorax sp. YR216]SEB13700.1 Predicted dithiol-disulfide isomerase, DsbA family [Variovorax sp. YR216]